MLDGLTFMYSDAAGDVPAGSIGGLVHADTRFLNRWELTLNDSRLLVLAADTVDHYSAAFFLTNRELPGVPANTIGLRRQRFVCNGLHERIELQCFATQPVAVRLRLAVGSDFADILEVKNAVRDRSAQIGRAHASDGSRLQFSYHRGPFEARFEVIVDPPASRIEGDDLVWDLSLQRGRIWRCELDVPLHYGPTELLPTHWYFGETPEAGRNDAATRWRAAAPTLHTDSELLRDVFHQSIDDLLSLRIELFRSGERVVLPAAGLPWFLSLFGRDTLITAYQTVAFGPHLARGALLTLAAYQGREVNEFKDEEPGKIMHEVRAGELTQLGDLPHSPYYGTADATQLWLILLSGVLALDPQRRVRPRAARQRLLGLDAQHGKLTLDPDIPEQIGRIQLTAAHGYGQRWDIEATGTQSYIRLASAKPVEY